MSIAETRADVNSFLALLSSWSHSVPLLHPAGRTYLGFMGAYHLELDGTCGDVLVLLSSCARHSYLVERMDHETPDCTICHRPVYVPLSPASSSTLALLFPPRLRLMSGTQALCITPRTITMLTNFIHHFPMWERAQVRSSPPSPVARL